MSMPPPKTVHPLSRTLAPTDSDTRAAMWQLFDQIGRFWCNVADSTPYRSRLYSFMDNRIDFDPLYKQYYATAQKVMADLIAQRGEGPAYEFLFTDAAANQTPPSTLLALTRQKVSNEFIALQLSLGGCLAFGATNYPGYFGGANVPGMPPPYRTFENA
jgi:hypothetical protein